MRIGPDHGVDAVTLKIDVAIFGHQTKSRALRE